MRATTIFLILQSLHILAFAQDSSNVDHWAIASIGFATTGDYSCRDMDDRPESIWLTLFSNITNPGCYNLLEIFSQQSCNPNALNCSAPFMTSDLATFSSTANYTRVFASFGRGPGGRFEDAVNATEPTFEVYDGADCEEVEHPPYQWSGCEESTYECTDLPFGVVSFYYTGSENANRTGDCLVGVVQGSEATRSGVLLGVVMIVAVVVGVMVV